MVEPEPKSGLHTQLSSPVEPAPVEPRHPSFSSEASPVEPRHPGSSQDTQDSARWIPDTLLFCKFNVPILSCPGGTQSVEPRHPVSNQPFAHPFGRRRSQPEQKASHENTQNSQRPTKTSNFRSRVQLWSIPASVGSERRTKTPNFRCPGGTSIETKTPNFCCPGGTNATFSPTGCPR